MIRPDVRHTPRACNRKTEVIPVLLLLRGQSAIRNSKFAMVPGIYRPVMRFLVPLLCLSPMLAGCMTGRVQPVTEYPSVPRQSTFLVKKVAYDKHGRPQFQERLHWRPGAAGEQFAIVHAVDEKPMRSYDIAIVKEQKPDMNKPLAVVYEWTGKGFEGGLVVAQGLFPNGFSGSGKEAAAYLVVKAAPVVIFGMAGFVVGLVASVPETAAELKHLVVNARETVLGYTVYEYDEKGRIRFMKLYPPVEHAEVLVKTEFFYQDDAVVPFRTEVNSLVEKKMRLLPSN